MSTALLGIDELIAIGPEGRARIAGTRIAVSWVAALAREPLSPQEIVEVVFDGNVSLAQIHAALAFYHRNREAIDADRAMLDAEYDRKAAASTWMPPEPTRR